MKKKSIYATEAELCSAFIAWAKTQGLQAYPETHNWDILLVAPDGIQIGIQAKMQFNMKVLSQAIEERWWGFNDATGPDFAAILLPENPGSSELLSALGLGCFHPDYLNRIDRPSFEPDLTGRNHSHDLMAYRNPTRRHTLPEYIPDVQAGAPAPMQLTKWKIAALKITAILELRGFVTRDDFRQIGIDHRRWVTTDWLAPDGAPGCWKRGPGLNFAAQHPTVYPQVKEDTEKWLAKGPAVVRPAQRAGQLALGGAAS